MIVAQLNAERCKATTSGTTSAEHDTGPQIRGEKSTGDIDDGTPRPTTCHSP